jgi:hypothetical protein
MVGGRKSRDYHELPDPSAVQWGRQVFASIGFLVTSRPPATHDAATKLDSDSAPASERAC